jgi:uncharacterized tellurite resistance protein B-like protein
VKKYNATALVDVEAGLKYSSILLAIVGADGEVADAELQWYIDEGVLLGCDQDYLDQVRQIDWRSVNIEESLKDVKFNFPLNIRRSLLYQAIKMSRADGVYHEKEKEAVAEAAKILEVDEAVLASIESVAEMEDAAGKLLHILLTSDA